MSDSPIEQLEAPQARRRLLGWAIALLGFLALAAAWSWTPLRELVRPSELADWLALVRHEPWAPLLVLAGFLLGGLLALPVTLMTVLTVTTFGPLLGFAYALIGSTASGMLSFGIGRALGRSTVERLAGGRVHRVSRYIGRHGLTAIAVLRMIPVAHFTVISLSAGVSHVRVRDFLFGTLLGMAPGLAAIALLVDRIEAVARQPDTFRLLGVFAAGAAIVAVLLGLRAWLRRRDRRR